MGRCPIEKLSDVKAVLAEIRKWPSVKEPKPGIFYIKRDPFLHFHVEDTQRWADIKTDGEFVSHDLPFSPSKQDIEQFLKSARKQHLAMTDQKKVSR